MPLPYCPAVPPPDPSPARLPATCAPCSHASGMHLAANLLGLYFFGRDISNLFGGRKASFWGGGATRRLHARLPACLAGWDDRD